jgi:hypothetical protein
MQAIQIGTAQTTSAAPPPASLATYAPPAPLSFDLTWLREVDGSATDPARLGRPQRQASGSAGTGRTAQAEVVSPREDRKATDGRSAEAAGTADARETDGRGLAKAASGFVADQAGAHTKNLARDVRNAASAASPGGPAKAKRAPQAAVPGSATAEAKPPAEPSPLPAGLAPPFVQAGSVTPPPPPGIAQNPADAGKVKSTLAKRDRVSVTEATGTVTNPLPAEKGAAAIALADSGAKTVSDPLAATQAAGGSSSHAHVDAAFSQLPASSIGLQPSVAGMAGVPTQTMAANHSQVPAPGTEARSGSPMGAGPAGLQGHQVLASGSAQLDVGVFDGTHGWLRVRAELGSDGAVSASLTASALGHESLRAVLPEMANYLEAEAVSVSKIAVHRAAEGAPNMAPNAGEGRGTGEAHPQRQEGQPRSEGSVTPGSDPSSADQLETAPATATTSSGPGSGQANDAAGSETGGARRGGSWLGDISPTRYGSGFADGSSGSWLNICA